MTITVDMHNQYQREYAQVCTLKAHIKMLKAGMTHSRMSKTQMMNTARRLTGAQFGTRDYDGAIKALEARRDALLVYINGG